MEGKEQIEGKGTEGGEGELIRKGDKKGEGEGKVQRDSSLEGGEGEENCLYRRKIILVLQILIYHTFLDHT